jgi:2-oxoglutarate dehydrogenase E1 component
MIDAPVIHVNADCPDDVVRAARIAFDYRMQHEADVVIDLIGYRRHGHSEHDIPAITQVADRLHVHEVVRRVITKWQASGADLAATADWCFAENLAYASLLEDGHSMRLSGMDVGRGTFMHRHAVWHAQDANETHPAAGRARIPLRHVALRQGAFDVVDSPLTEEGVLGFEYGYSVQTSGRLTIWEAQYGDFVNGAQIIIDQYIASGEYKWGYQSGLTVLLPHGHEGVGPEHSNAYLGRFLQLCAGDNLRVVMTSTSAQWFHLLREQAMTEGVKPLIVTSPKSQLYGNPACIRV